MFYLLVWPQETQVRFICEFHPQDLFIFQSKVFKKRAYAEPCPQVFVPSVPPPSCPRYNGSQLGVNPSPYPAELNMFLDMLQS